METQISSNYPSLTDARDFYNLAIEEYNTGERKKQKDACEKAYRAATEALDVFLYSRGYKINVDKPEAHQQRGIALEELIDINPVSQTISSKYDQFKSKLHGICFYTDADPTVFERRLRKVKDFIDLIEDSL